MCSPMIQMVTTLTKSGRNGKTNFSKRSELLFHVWLFPANLPNQVADHHPSLTRKFCRLFERSIVFSKACVGATNQFTWRYTVEQGTNRRLPYAELNRSTSTKKRAYLLIRTTHPPLVAGRKKALLAEGNTTRRHATSSCIIAEDRWFWQRKSRITKWHVYKLECLPQPRCLPCLSFHSILCFHFR